MAIYHQLSRQSRGRHKAPRKKTVSLSLLAPTVGLEFDTQVFAQVSLLIRETGCRMLPLLPRINTNTSCEDTKNILNNEFVSYYNQVFPNLL